MSQSNSSLIPSIPSIRFALLEWSNARDVDERGWAQGRGPAQGWTVVVPPALAGAYPPLRVVEGAELEAAGKRVRFRSLRTFGAAPQPRPPSAHSWPSTTRCAYAVLMPTGVGDEHLVLRVVPLAAWRAGAALDPSIPALVPPPPALYGLAVAQAANGEHYLDVPGQCRVCGGLMPPPPPWNDSSHATCAPQPEALLAAERRGEIVRCYYDSAWRWFLARC